MSAAIQTLAEELESYRTICFWWVSKSVPIINLPREKLIHGLQLHGGWAGMRLAARL